MRTIWHDMRYGLRQLRRSPGFTAVAVLSLALGIGVNTAIFSLINGMLYKSLPVRDLHELRIINWTCDTSGVLWIERYDGYGGITKSNQRYRGSFPYPAYREFIKMAQGFSHIFAFSCFEEPKTINAGGVATLAHMQAVSGSFFEGYGAQVLIGRPITPEDDRPGAPPVAVLTYSLWQRLYGLDPNVIGQTLTVGQTGLTIIGVLPRRYVGPVAGGTRTDFYVPMTVEPRLLDDEEDMLNSYDAWWVQIMGRLAPGANEAQIQASLELPFSQIVERSEVKLGKRKLDRTGIWLQEGKHGVLGERRGMAKFLWYLEGLVSLVLLIACTNLAGLLLARGAARQHEMAVRAAMGAGRWRLIRQTLTESMILSLGGVCLGLLFSAWLSAVMASYLFDPSKYQHLNVQTDTNVLMFALAVGVATTLLSGLFPALRAGNADPSAGLKESTSRGAPRLRLGKVLVSAQVSMSVLLVVLVGLLSRSMINIYRTDPGFDTENLLLVPVDPGQSLNPPKNREDFFYALRRKIAGIPGVKSAALSDRTLFDFERWTVDISIPGRPDAKPGKALRLIVSDEYLATIGINLLQGRDFRATDTRNSQKVAIVNEKFAREFFPDENPVGQFFGPGDYQIVGLCSNHSYCHMVMGISPMVYMPYSQFWRSSEMEMTYAIRSVLPPLSLVPAVRKAVAEIDRDLPLEGITTQKLELRESLAILHQFTLLCGSLTLLALALSCIGLYGIMSYRVARQTGEIGIRKALGARPWDVAWPILRGALILTAIGVAVGLPVALALVRVIRILFYGIEPHDPLTVIGTVVLMVVVAALAAWVPARRAAKVDPMEALRYE